MKKWNCTDHYLDTSNLQLVKYMFLKKKKVISDIMCGYYNVKIDIYICTVYMRIVINEIFYIDDK